MLPACEGLPIRRPVALHSIVCRSIRKYTSNLPLLVVSRPSLKDYLLLQLALYRDCQPTLQAVQNVDMTLYDDLNAMCLITQNGGGGGH